MECCTTRQLNTSSQTHLYCNTPKAKAKQNAQRNSHQVIPRTSKFQPESVENTESAAGGRPKTDRGGRRNTGGHVRNLSGYSYRTRPRKAPGSSPGNAKPAGRPPPQARSQRATRRSRGRASERPAAPRPHLAGCRRWPRRARARWAAARARAGSADRRSAGRAAAWVQPPAGSAGSARKRRRCPAARRAPAPPVWAGARGWGPAPERRRAPPPPPPRPPRERAPPPPPPPRQGSPAPRAARRRRGTRPQAPGRRRRPARPRQPPPRRRRLLCFPPCFLLWTRLPAPRTHGVTARRARAPTGGRARGWRRRARCGARDRARERVLRRQGGRRRRRSRDAPPGRAGRGPVTATRGESPVVGVGGFPTNRPRGSWRPWGRGSLRTPPRRAAPAPPGSSPPPRSRPRPRAQRPLRPRPCPRLRPPRASSSRRPAAREAVTARPRRQRQRRARREELRRLRGLRRDGESRGPLRTPAEEPAIAYGEELSVLTAGTEGAVPQRHARPGRGCGSRRRRSGGAGEPRGGWRTTRLRDLQKYSHCAAPRLRQIIRSTHEEVTGRLTPHPRSTGDKTPNENPLVHRPLGWDTSCTGTSIYLCSATATLRTSLPPGLARAI